MSLPAEVSARVQQAAAALKKATALVITAGAGMGRRGEGLRIGSHRQSSLPCAIACALR